MKRGHARLGVLLAVLGGIMGTLVPSASATTLKAVSFTATAVLTDCPGLGFPGAPPDFKLPDPVFETKTGPKGEPEFNVRPQGNHCNFRLVSTICEKTSLGKKTGLKDPCQLLAVGAWWGFCGFGTGVGTLQINNLSGTKDPVVTDFKFTDVLGWTISGGGNRTNVKGKAPTVVPTIGSCTNKTAVGFLITGTLNYKDITGL